MHTTTMMRSADFDYTVDGRPAALEHIFPAFNRHDRVGVVVRQPGGGIGASALVMAAMTRFYDFHRERLGGKPGQLRIYPEFYVFHVGKRHMDHYWMDIWPPHKEVDVADEPEQILEAVNDRGITRLLVQDITPAKTVSLYASVSGEKLDPSMATFLRETVSSAESRIMTAVAFSPSGRTEQADIAIGSCPAAESFVLASINSSQALTDSMRDQLKSSRLPLQTEGRVIETYRRITLSNAIGMLTPSTKLSMTTRHYIENM
ncbi:MAG: hypothetical protein ACQEXQ_08380 [Bacillota bacterium]